MRLLHLRERSRGGRQDLHVRRAGHRRGGARSRRGRDGVPVHPRRQTGGFVPSRAGRVERHGIRVHRGLPGALRERRAGANGPVTALQRGGADEGRAAKVKGDERLARADARVDVRSVGGRTGRGASRVRVETARVSTSNPRPRGRAGRALHVGDTGGDRRDEGGAFGRALRHPGERSEVARARAGGHRPKLSRQGEHRHARLAGAVARGAGVDRRVRAPDLRTRHADPGSPESHPRARRRSRRRRRRRRPRRRSRGLALNASRRRQRLGRRLPRGHSRPRLPRGAVAAPLGARAGHPGRGLRARAEARGAGAIRRPETLQARGPFKRYSWVPRRRRRRRRRRRNRGRRRFVSFAAVAREGPRDGGVGSMDRRARRAARQGAGRLGGFREGIRMVSGSRRVARVGGRRREGRRRGEEANTFEAVALVEGPEAGGRRRRGRRRVRRPSPARRAWVRTAPRLPPRSRGDREASTPRSFARARLFNTAVRSRRPRFRFRFGFGFAFADGDGPRRGRGGDAAAREGCRLRRRVRRRG
mmetsp:Transcript_2929/g.10914  ORF Transcript_2929/g.10914 Transcript_2929/m.10914 type:complete len:533 (+) Transcript_2929:274-1872(+)